MQDLYAENYEVLQEVIKELNRCCSIPCSWIGKLKDASSPQMYVEIMCNLNQNPTLGIWIKLLIKFTWK